MLSRIAGSLIETVFGDAKEHGMLRQANLRPLDRVDLLFALAAAVVNPRRLPKLLDRGAAPRSSASKRA